jgi:CRISPR-associated protein (TIGR02584 family)
VRRPSGGDLQGDRQRPESYPRRVLVTVSGLTPQIITETLYALVTRERPFVPTEVHVITTAIGKQRFLDHREQLDSLFQEYDLPPARCEARDIHLIDGPDGAAMDVRTPADNERLANLIMQTVLELTGDPDCAVHASIAGGRKTMGFYLGYLMSMFGRDQDRISHVLVHEDYESLPDFFYPPRVPRIFRTRDGRLFTPGPDAVLLSEIPFVRHRGGFSDQDLRREGMSFRQAVDLAQRSVLQVELVIDIAERRVQAGGIDVKLADNPLAFLAWLADCRKRGIEAVRFSDPPQAFLDWYERILDDRGSLKHEETRRAVSRGFTEEDFRYRVHTVNEGFQRALGRTRAAEYSIKLLKRRSGRYSLTLPATAITIRGRASG